MEDNKPEEFSQEYLKILKENEHYEVFPIIYSVKDILYKYSGEQYMYDTCQLCFIEPIATYTGWHNEKEEGFEETENMNMCIVNNLAKNPSGALCSLSLGRNCFLGVSNRLDEAAYVEPAIILT